MVVNIIDLLQLTNFLHWSFSTASSRSTIKGPGSSQSQPQSQNFFLELNPEGQSTTFFNAKLQKSAPVLFSAIPKVTRGQPLVLLLTALFKIVRFTSTIGHNKLETRLAAAVPASQLSDISRSTVDEFLHLSRLISLDLQQSSSCVSASWRLQTCNSLIPISQHTDANSQAATSPSKEDQKHMVT